MFLQWIRQLRYFDLIETVVLVAASLLCITFHEVCHGLAALWLGDDTAKRMGRLTLNPLRHVDITGLIVMAVVKFGWAKPVPVDMRNFRNPKIGMAVTAVAGPISNMLLAFVALMARVPVVILYYRYETPYLMELVLLFLEYIAVLSTGLAVFNLFPIPPLDGSKFVGAVLPSKAYMYLLRFERYGMLILGVLLLLGVFDTPLHFLRQELFGFLAYIPDHLSDFWIRVLL